MRLQRSKLILFGLLLIFCCAIGCSDAAEVPSLPLEVERAVSRIPVQHNGRVKPFDSFAREALDLITGSRSLGKRSPTETILHILAFPEHWEGEPLLSVPYRPLRQELGLSPKESHLSYRALFAASFMRRLPPIVEKQRSDEKLTFLENETMELYSRFTALHTLFTGELHLVPSANQKEALWVPLEPLSDLKEADREKLQKAWQGFLSAYREGNREGMLQGILAFTETVRSLYPAAVPEGWRFSLEVWYNRLDPLHWAWVLYGMAALLFGLSLQQGMGRIRLAALTLFIGSFLFLHAGAIVVRMVLAGRPPVSNFYESMLWLSFITLLLGFLFELRQRSSHFGLASALFGGATLLVSEHLPLDPSIQPIVAVLRSNFWLSIHVLTIVGSYGVLTLATGIAHVYAGSFLLRRERVLVSLGDALYRVVQIGVILLAAGTMLGGVWANASWGRYWGWDPKETWALITLLWFLALLHARKANWIGSTGLAGGTILGFFLLLMTYYGVSFYLVGLHSYAGGSAKPIPPLLIGFLFAECLLLLSVAFFRPIRTAK